MPDLIFHDCPDCEGHAPEPEAPREPIDWEKATPAMKALREELRATYGPAASQEAEKAIELWKRFT